MTTLFLAISLIILITVNIVLGSITAMFSGEFDWRRFRTGILKGFVIFLCLGLVYLAGWLSPDIIAFEVTGQTVNLMQATYLVVLAGYIYYGTNVITKYYNILTGGSKEKPPD